ncbi:hypothetical protein G3A_12350 [Bacillus sp. 17376]|uniref:Transporter n=1 Tax=Mesobacillus boroniphilus JCM 21738 TaxID=1294265 RepID=W4RIY5_9BACI|nr:hypothetical protein G3A_12350 [Bacillus sp. 17376]GAE43848.1 transporter [Mesobacillus boroniphilus JCM 21738]
MNTRMIVRNGILAALYIAVSAVIQPFGFTNVQFRVSEMFNHLIVWAVPAGGKETGYEAEIVRQLFMKSGVISGVKVKVQYFEIKVTGREIQIQDPDGLIHEIAWKKVSEMSETSFSSSSFPCRTIRISPCSLMHTPAEPTHNSIPISSLPSKVVPQIRINPSTAQLAFSN